MEKLKNFKLNLVDKSGFPLIVNDREIEKGTRITLDFIAGKTDTITVTSYEEIANNECVVNTYQCNGWGEECEIEVKIKNKDYHSLFSE